MPNDRPDDPANNQSSDRSSDRLYDLVLFGATGFTGTLTAEYLAEHAPGGCRWALAGRDPGKLEALRDRLATLNPACAELPVLHADVTVPATLSDIATKARIVITTVGPYITYGEPLVAACAEAGTDYVDLTGEPEFVDLMYLRHHDTAVASGARIVHSCGFDSIPHDLGAYFTVRQLPEGVPLRVEGFVRAAATISGGTLHTMITIFSRTREALTAHRRRRRAEPRLDGRTARAVSGRPHYNGAWALPMASIDPDVVRRSAAALDRYGPDFTYRHYVAVKRLPAAAGLIAGVAGLFALAQIPATRALLLKIKKPGDGPTAEQRERSWFKVRFRGEGGGRRVVTEVAGGDPGYGETAKMLAESALCLAYDDLPETAGQVTTATAMGDALIERLRRAGISFTVVTTAAGRASGGSASR